MRDELISRWNLDLGNIRQHLDKILSGIDFPKNMRGRPFKRKPKTYVKLLVLKEYFGCSLRKAECLLSERIDHSVLHFWEKRLDKQFIERLVGSIAKRLKIGYDFSFVDSTMFTTWKNRFADLHIMARISKETVYPVSIFFGKASPSNAVKATLVEGSGKVLGDRWYDDNKTFKVLIKNGYTPIVKAQRTRCSGSWRRKARIVYDKRVYRQRGRGESIFGSLTNEFGDRLKSVRPDVTMTRIACRFIVYLVKLIMRQRTCSTTASFVVTFWNY